MLLSFQRPALSRIERRGLLRRSYGAGYAV
jgi:hypothetical protein